MLLLFFVHKIKASLICGLMVDLGYLFTLNNSSGGGESFYNDINVKKPLGISLHERRGYFVSPDANGMEERRKREIEKGRSLELDVLTDTNETQTLSTTSIQHQHNGVSAIMDPTELLQLPPAVIANRLRLIAASAYESLKAASKASGGSSSKFGGESLITWFIDKGVVRSAAHAMLLGNILYNHGCIQLYKSGKGDKNDNDNEVEDDFGNSNPKRGGLARGDSAAMFKSASDSRLPFGDAPDMIPSSLINAGGNLSNSANEFLSNSKISKMRFQFTFMKGSGDSKSGIPPGTPLAPTPTPEALEYMKNMSKSSGGGGGGGSSSKFSAMGSSLLNMANNNIVNDYDLDALSRELAAEEAALKNDTKVGTFLSHTFVYIPFLALSNANTLRI
jgi:hypothetical protein